MKRYRGFWALGLGVIFVLAPFLIFVATGWPGRPADCVFQESDSCYCEHFERLDVLQHAAGVRQRVNTWSNLYSLVSASLLAFCVYADRKRSEPGVAPNLMRSGTLMPDLYIFVVLLRGLGSMWFHASLTHWGGIVDGFVMYVYGAFLVFYSVRRLWNNALVFWCGFLATIILFTVLHSRRPDSVFVLALVLFLAYLAVEIAIWIRTRKVMQGRPTTIMLWVSAALAILLATLFWTLSQAGGPMCWPRSGFQAHGLLWHPLAGLMGVLLYFYWREAKDPGGGTRC
jgi:hypothetical protein